MDNVQIVVSQALGVAEGNIDVKVGAYFLYFPKSIVASLVIMKVT